MSATSLYPAEVFNVLDRMRATAGIDPADQLWVEAIMELAQLIVELEPDLQDGQTGVLIAIGALMMPLALAESQAEGEARALLERLKVAPRG